MEVKFPKAKWNVSLHDLQRYDTIKRPDTKSRSGLTSFGSGSGLKKPGSYSKF